MLRLAGRIELPAHNSGGFDHADVHIESGKLYVAHTANDSVEVVDGRSLNHVTTVKGCLEASGVLCAQTDGLVFAAARGAGKILVIGVGEDKVLKEVQAGTKPNGLAWDSRRRRLLAADVEDNQARLLDPIAGRLVSSLQLRGRPRWSIYDERLDLFLVNIRDPPGIEVISPIDFVEKKFVAVASPGPHGLDLVPGTGSAYVACDSKELVLIDFLNEREIARVPLSGEPDVVWLNQEKRCLYCAIGTPGVIDVVDTDRISIRDRIVTEPGAHTLSFDKGSQRLYSLLPRTHSVAVYAEV